MSHTTRSKPVPLMVCDLCDQEITREHTDGGYEFANLITSQGGIRRPEARTKHVRLWWNPRTWPSHKRRTVEQWPEEDQKFVSRDFHGRCIVRLVEENLNVYATPTHPSA